MVATPLPEEIARDSAKAVAFFGAAVTKQGLRVPPFLHAHLCSLAASLPDKEVYKLLQQCFTVHFPAYANTWPDGELAYESSNIRAQLKDIFTLVTARVNSAAETERNSAIALWTVCCLTAQRAVPSELDEIQSEAAKWLEAFAEALRRGTEIIAPDALQQFALGVRWVLSAVPEWPEAVEASDGTAAIEKIFLSTSREDFSRLFSLAEDDEAIRAGWRAAVYLAASEDGNHALWKAMLRSYLNLSLNKPTRDDGYNTNRVVKIPVKVQPIENTHGLDCIVPVVGSHAVGKTSFLLTLAGAELLEYRNVEKAEPGQNPKWGNSLYPDLRRKWTTQENFNTPTGLHLRLQAREREARDDLRMVLYDAAGERLQDTMPGANRELEAFTKVMDPSAYIYMLHLGQDDIGAKDSRAAAMNFSNTLQRKAGPQPMVVLFNRADAWFGRKDDKRRETLLGANPELLDTAELKKLTYNGERGDGRIENVRELLALIAESERWAQAPRESIAFENAIALFEAEINNFLGAFDRVLFGFTCCKGNREPVLRRSAAAIFANLRERVRIATVVARREDMRKRFVDSIKEREAELRRLKELGTQLAAMVLPNARPGDGSLAAQKISSDWDRLRRIESRTELEAELDSICAELRRFAEELPVEDRWKELANPKTTLGWLIASLGIPIDISIEKALDEYAAVAGEAQNACWGSETSGWNGPILFSPEYDKGAGTVPSEWQASPAPGVLKLQQLAGEINAGDAIYQILRKLAETGTPSDVQKAVRALTHGQKGRGLFPEQSLRLGDPDYYAYASVDNTAVYFEKGKSIARCMDQIADILYNAARVVFSQEGSNRVSLKQIATEFTAAYILQLLRFVLDEPPTGADLENEKSFLKRIVSALFGTTCNADDLLRDAARKNLKELQVGSHEFADWLQNVPGPVAKRLGAARRIGNLLQETAAERFRGLLYAKLLYALESGWLNQQERHQLEIVRLRLEDQEDVWDVYTQESPGLNAKGLQAVFEAFTVRVHTPPKVADPA